MSQCKLEIHKCLQCIQGTLESIFPDIFTHEHFRIVTHSLQTAWSGDTLPCRVPWTADWPVRIYDARIMHSQLVDILDIFKYIHNAYFMQGLCVVSLSLNLEIVPWTPDWPVRIYDALYYVSLYSVFFLLSNSFVIFIKDLCIALSYPLDSAHLRCTQVHSQLVDILSIFK